MAAMGPARKRGAASAELLELMLSMEKEDVFKKNPKTTLVPPPGRIPQTPPGDPRPQAQKRKKEEWDNENKKEKWDNYNKKEEWEPVKKREAWQEHNEAWLEEEAELEAEKREAKRLADEEQQKEEEEKQEEEKKTQKEEEEKQRAMFAQIPEEMKAVARFEVMHEMDLMQRLTEDCAGHPWAVRPNAKTRSFDLTEHEKMRLKMEEEASRHAQIPWQERGPRQDESYKETGKPSTPCWRGQSWRTGSYGGKERYAKRGGKHQAYYDRLNKAGLLKPTRHGAVRVKTPGAW